MNNVWEHTMTQEDLPVMRAYTPAKITDVMRLISGHQSKLMTLIRPVYPHVIQEIDEMGGRLLRDIVAFFLCEEKKKELPPSPPSQPFPRYLGDLQEQLNTLRMIVINPDEKKASPDEKKSSPDEEKEVPPVKSLSLTSAEIKALRVSERVLLAVYENDEASVDMISKKTKINASSIYRAIRENRRWFVTRPSTKGKAVVLYSLNSSGRNRVNLIHRHITTKRKKACPPTPKPSLKCETSGT